MTFDVLVRIRNVHDDDDDDDDDPHLNTDQVGV